MPTKRILVTGANGQLGQSIRLLATQTTDDFIFVTRNELDLSQTESIADYFKTRDFDWIINCAAYTAVDKAEQEPELADAVNHLAVKQLAEIAQQRNSKLIHVSTDYVYDGQGYKPYHEYHPTHPQNSYGVSKLKGELAIQQVAPDAVIIRTSWVYSEFGHNFVKTMLNLGQSRDQLNIVFDQIGTPTYAVDLAQMMLHIIAKPQAFFSSEETPVYHYSNEGVCSWYDFTKAIFELSHIACQVLPIESKDYPTPAKRPHYSVLNKAKIKHCSGQTIPYWKDALQRCLLALEENKP